MPRPRVYLDTSVVGGCCDDEFRKWSLALVNDIRAGLLLAVVSDLTEAELKDAPAEVQAVYDGPMECETEVLHESPESMALAGKYIAEGVVGPNLEHDARHVALAAVAAVDMVVSWNFRHIVRFDKIQRFNAVDALMGYRPLQIFTPMEVASGEF